MHSGGEAKPRKSWKQDLRKVSCPPSSLQRRDPRGSQDGASARPTLEDAEAHRQGLRARPVLCRQACPLRLSRGSAPPPRLGADEEGGNLVRLTEGGALEEVFGEQLLRVRGVQSSRTGVPFPAQRLASPSNSLRQHWGLRSGKRPRLRSAAPTPKDLPGGVETCPSGPSGPGGPGPVQATRVTEPVPPTLTPINRPSAPPSLGQIRRSGGPHRSPLWPKALARGLQALTKTVHACRPAGLQKAIARGLLTTPLQSTASQTNTNHAAATRGVGAGPTWAQGWSKLRAQI